MENALLSVFSMTPQSVTIEVIGSTYGREPLLPNGIGSRNALSVCVVSEGSLGSLKMLVNAPGDWWCYRGHRFKVTNRCVFPMRISYPSLLLFQTHPKEAKNLSKWVEQVSRELNKYMAPFSAMPPWRIYYFSCVAVQIVKRLPYRAWKRPLQCMKYILVKCIWKFWMKLS